MKSVPSASPTPLTKFNKKRLYRHGKPFDSGSFPTADGKHEIQYYRSGRPGARPALVVHGGPGGESDPDHRGFFHPNCWEVIQVDQRGCGLSKPFGSLDNNDTDHLIDDFELLREKLGIPEWTLWGGSWGTFLSLAYAQKVTDRIAAIVLRAVCLMGDAEMTVCFEPSGAAVTFPERYREFVEYIPPEERHDIVAAYYKRMVLESDPALQMEAAFRWSRWLTALDIDDDGAPYTLSREDVAGIRMECLYSQTRGFRRPNQLLEEAHKLRAKPTMIVHGRRDLLCPPVNAVQLHWAIPGSELTVVEKEGHSPFTTGMAAAILKYTNGLVQ